MSTKEVDAILYVKQIPEITFEDGHFHVRYEVGNRSRFEFVFSPNTFLRMRAKSAKVVDQFHEGKAEVSAIGRKRSPAAH